MDGSRRIIHVLLSQSLSANDNSLRALATQHARLCEPRRADIIISVAGVRHAFRIEARALRDHDGRIDGSMPSIHIRTKT